MNRALALLCVLSVAPLAAYPATRTATFTVAATVVYDSSRSTPWGDGSMGTSLVSGAGANSSRALTVYGTLPAQAVTAAGDYQDTVIVTVTY